MRHPVFVSWLALGVSASIVACTDAADVETSWSAQALESEVEPAFHHPLMGQIRGGKALVFDIKDAPNGKRYSLRFGARSKAEGHFETESGIVELDVESVADAKAPVDPVFEEPAILTDHVRSAIAEDPTKLQVLSVHVGRPRDGTASTDLLRGIAEGRVTSWDDVGAFQRGLRIGRQAAVEAAQEPVVKLVQALGGRVRHRLSNIAALSIELPGSAVEALLTRAPQITAIDFPGKMHDDADGLTIEAGSQTALYVDAHRGDIAGVAVEVAQIETNLPFLEHLGFNNGSIDNERITSRFDCSTSDCTAVADSDTSHDDGHATLVASVLLGDLIDGQDASISVGNPRVARSGIAREARLVSIAGSDWTEPDSELEFGLDFLLDPDAPAVRVANMSSSLEDVNGDPLDQTCLGRTPGAQAVNAAFEDGIAFFKSAANKGNTVTSNCKVGDPGSAIGAFTVGAHGQNGGVSGDEDDVRDDAIRSSNSSSGSSRGGTSTEGQGRTIIDMTAYGCRQLMYGTSGGYGVSTCGTSVATPVVAGFATTFIDWFQSTQGSLPSPGMVYANLLLMGDRMGEGAYRTTRFDGLWGAGRLQARMFSNAGMDSPWEWATGSTCIDHAEDTSVNINMQSGTHQPLPANAGYVKAAIWWYDHRHGDGSPSYPVDNIDLRLQQDNNTGGTPSWGDTPSANSNAPAKENKEFLFKRALTSGIDAKKIRLRIKGTNVAADGAGCGTNSMLVYWAFFWEDENRDDSDGPSASTVDPEDEH